MKTALASCRLAVVMFALVSGAGQFPQRAKDAGFNGLVFIPTYSILSNAADTTIQAAQTALVDNVQCFGGGNIDSLTGTANRQADGTHLTTAGQSSGQH